ncbi:MAG: succinate-semialdehyde dehydrogenase (NADP(+)), partial [Rhodospirillaceae bacterium]|nr:succinate-semialdehyde dehydrogenase (NADP(+)) [Rhodospirillaceae bacterium]
MKLDDSSLLRQQCYINGEWVDAPSGAKTEVKNPADGSIIGTVPALGQTETKHAIESADRSWPEWRKKTGKERCNILRGWY